MSQQANETEQMRQLQRRIDESSVVMTAALQRVGAAMAELTASMQQFAAVAKDSPGQHPFARTQRWQR